ncbi:RNA polymerase recycling motor HelD [Lactiplantibacillus fabifermentans]|uniref:DNA helicase n=2 Tax=Lactiplantibacillus fabifermentans TaxID=483011 RepID=A0A0R2NYU7_9LACO|nr:RNA polymerase recycling motor HelD [Lactiplantibacillus fabifermentans]ETY75061.1 ATP-dependent DNA helicase [Lactiplantibacillus fabifermentans T30PCM01]KRO29472.1 DNA helicase [Lactiplantibacillus fabifermentans DSM 21115]
MAKSIKASEQEHLDEVVGKIRIEEQKQSQTIARSEKDQADIKQNFYNDVNIKTDSYEGMMETGLSVRQQQQMLDERQNSWQHATKQLSTLKKLEKNAYFARLDFHEKGEPATETIYIGLSSFSDSPDHFLIYDWRAPISSIYYDGGLGHVTYQTPDGPQQVDVQLKRQLMIEDGSIVTVYDTDEAVGDSMLLEVLDEKSSTKMKSIVTTIQKEQNTIIRDTSSDLLFVQGAAGSGKTSSVLQRVAYLLYRYRGNLTAGQVILFSPNQLFNDYINQVLPELGEQNMVQMTYFQYASYRLPHMQVETLQQRFETENTPAMAKITKLEGSLAFFKAVTAYGNHLEQADMRFRNITLNGEVIIPREKIKEIYYNFNENYHLGVRLSATKEALIKILNSKVEAEMRTKWVEETVQDLSREEINNLYGNQPREFKNGDQEFKFLARKIVMQRLGKARTQIVRNRFLSINLQYAHFLREVPKILNLDKYDITRDEWDAAVEQKLAAIKDRHISLTTVSAYMYLHDLMTGKKGQREIRFVFLDEIQDYNAFQLAFLKFSFPNARFTMLGDLNQAIFTKENSHTLIGELETLFDPEKTRVVQLTKSYRSTQQITDFTKEILVNGEAVTAFDRQGDLPNIAITGDFDSAVDQVVDQLAMNDSDRDTTAIIGKTLAECERLTQALKDRGEHVTLIRTENQRLAPGCIIVPSFLAKGLEFDAVIVWNANADNYAREDERQLLYTICSRAMHELTITSVGALSPLLSRVNSALYTLDEATV